METLKIEMYKINMMDSYSRWQAYSCNVESCYWWLIWSIKYIHWRYVECDYVSHTFFVTAGLKKGRDQGETPPRTPTGNAPSSESDIDNSSPNVSNDESLAKELALKDSVSDLSHRPKRRRFHESYNFNMKCPTPGCNSLGIVISL